MRKKLTEYRHIVWDWNGTLLDDTWLCSESLNRLRIGRAEPAAKRSYIAFEYGAGDNSYGATFDRHSAQMVTNIHDGDLEHCTVTAETCAFADDWNAVKTDPDFATVSTTTVTQASQLSGVDQAMIALRSSYDDVSSLAEGILRTDDHVITVVELRHKATDIRVQAFVYHAGDTAVGRIYYRNTTDRAAAINDLFIEGFTLVESCAMMDPW